MRRILTVLATCALAGSLLAPVAVAQSSFEGGRLGEPLLSLSPMVLLSVAVSFLRLVRELTSNATRASGTRLLLFLSLTRCNACVTPPRSTRLLTIPLSPSVIPAVLSSVGTLLSKARLRRVLPRLCGLTSLVFLFRIPTDLLTTASPTLKMITPLPSLVVRTDFPVSFFPAPRD